MFCKREHFELLDHPFISETETIDVRSHPLRTTRDDNGLTLVPVSDVAMGSSIAATTLLVIMTWWKTFQLRRALSSLGQRTALLDLLMRDGESLSFPLSM